MSGLERNVVLIFVSVLAVVCLTGCKSETPFKSKEAYMYEPVAVWDAASTEMELDKILGIGIDSKGRVYATAGKGKMAWWFLMRMARSLIHGARDLSVSMGLG